MVQFNFSHVLSSLILGIAIVIGCLIIQNNDKEQNLGPTEVQQTSSYKPLMTIEETAKYLNLSELQIRTIISSEESMLKTTGTYSGKMFPVIKIRNDIYISTSDLNVWLNEATTQRKQY